MVKRFAGKAAAVKVARHKRQGGVPVSLAAAASMPVLSLSADVVDKTCPAP